jgi:hypothetical protein
VGVTFDPAQLSDGELVGMLIGGEGEYDTKGTHNGKDDSTTAH